MMGGLLLLCLSLGEGAAFTLDGPRLEAELVAPRRAEVCPSLESLGALCRRREADLHEGAELGLLLDSFDRAAGLDPFRGSRGSVASESPAMLSTWLDALGTPLDKRLFVGVTIDLFGPEEVEGLRPAHVDARQSAPRINYLSTGLGLRFKL